MAALHSLLLALAGWRMSHYSMTKAALSAFAESLHKKVCNVGVRSVAFDCGGFIINLMQSREGDHAAPPSEATEAYNPLLTEFVCDGPDGTYAG